MRLAAETTGPLAATPTQGLSTGSLLVACPWGQFVLPYRDSLRDKGPEGHDHTDRGGVALRERHSGGVGDYNIGKAYLALASGGLLAGTEAGKAKTQAPGDPGWGASFPFWQASEDEPRGCSKCGEHYGAYDEAEYTHLLPASVSPLFSSIPPASLRQ